MDANELQNRYTAGEMVALLIGTDLMGTNLSGASLTEANLAGAMTCIRCLPSSCVAGNYGFADTYRVFHSP